MTRRQTIFFWRLWANACKTQGWKSSDNDRRHAVVEQALGYGKSSKFFSNAEFDRVKHALEALARPEDVGALVAVMEPRVAAEADERKRLVWRIAAELKKGNLAEAYVEAICREQFDTIRWRQLPLGQLNQLKLTMIERVRSRQRVLKAREGTYENA